jgi:hypothetical protein
MMNRPIISASINARFPLSIDFGLGDMSERVIGGLLLLESLMEHGGAVTVAELFRPRDQRAIARDFIMFNGLSCADQSRVKNLLSSAWLSAPRAARVEEAWSIHGLDRQGP